MGYPLSHPIRTQSNLEPREEVAGTNGERTRFLLKHMPADFDWQAIPAHIRARYDFRETLAERDRIRCCRHGRRVTGDAIVQVWRGRRGGRHLAWESFPSKRQGGNLQ